MLQMPLYILSYFISAVPNVAGNATSNIDTLIEMLCEYIFKQTFILSPGV